LVASPNQKRMCPEALAASGRPLMPVSPVTRGYDRLIDALGVIAALCLLVMPVLIGFDVFIRAFKLGSIKWVADVCEYLMFFSTFLGAPWLMRLGLHVRVDILLTALPRNAAKVFEQALDTFCMGICLVLAYYGALAAIDAYQLGLKQYKALTVADWPFHATFTFTMVLLSIEFFRRIRRPSAALDTKDPTVGM
jgi:TRAP-type C4-dicarboxylate transport system permease small subunit